jgi:hypothetical protein
MIYTATATIYDTPEISQDVIFDYEFHYTGSKNVVTYCLIKLPLIIKATWLEHDVQVAIADNLECPIDKVSIETEIEFPLQDINI